MKTEEKLSCLFDLSHRGTAFRWCVWRAAMQGGVCLYSSFPLSSALWLTYTWLDFTTRLTSPLVYSGSEACGLPRTHTHPPPLRSIKCSFSGSWLMTAGRLMWWTLNQSWAGALKPLLQAVRAWYIQSNKRRGRWDHVSGRHMLGTHVLSYSEWNKPQIWLSLRRWTPSESPEFVGLGANLPYRWRTLRLQLLQGDGGSAWCWKDSCGRAEPWEDKKSRQLMWWHRRNQNRQEHMLKRNSTKKKKS